MYGTQFRMLPFFPQQKKHHSFDMRGNHRHRQVRTIQNNLHSYTAKKKELIRSSLIAREDTKSQFDFFFLKDAVPSVKYIFKKSHTDYGYYFVQTRCFTMGNVSAYKIYKIQLGEKQQKKKVKLNDYDDAAT